MLNPDKIRDIEFEQSVIGGYRRDEVDKFIDEVEEHYRKLFNENKEMREKLEACLAKIENYRKDEEFLKTAIINAQRLNETTLREIELREKEAETTSKEKAAKIIEEAENRAKELVHNAEVECADAVRAARERSKAEIEAEQNAANDAIKEIRSEIDAEQKKLDYLKTQVSEFKNTILDIYRAHVTSISKLPDFKAEEPEPVAKETAFAPEIKEEPPVAKAAPVAEEAAPAPAKAESEPDEDPIDKNTVEFKIEPKSGKKAATVEEEVASGVSQIKFDTNFKFGVDYDINKDE